MNIRLIDIRTLDPGVLASSCAAKRGHDRAVSSGATKVFPMSNNLEMDGGLESKLTPDKALSAPWISSYQLLSL